MRLPNGFGSVYKLSGNRRKPWVARKTTGWTFDEEKQKSYPIYAFVGYYESRKEALTALAEYNKDPYDLHHNTITFAEVFEKWSEVHFPKVSDSNVKGYKASFRTCEKLHNMKFVEIKLDHLQQAVDESGKNTPTLKKMKIMFGLMYDYAVMHEIVTADKRDMVRYVDITKAGNPNAYNRKPFNKKQINMVWKVKDSNTYYSVILMLIYTGVRIGDDDDKIRLNQRKPSKYKGLRRFGPEKNLQRINKFMKERPIFYKNLIQMKENIRFYLRCFYCITKVMILQFNSENRTELARNG